IIQSPVSLPEQDDSDLLIELIQSMAIDASLPLTSLPDDAPIRLLESSACDTLRQALKIWVTVICPRLDKETDCVLLAAIEFSTDATDQLIINLDEQNALIPGTVTIDESERPIMVPDRLKQELFCLFGGRTAV
ncbi:hypothetical protein, partial [Nitrosomonas nitrosa]|uniref:hypothetical protein n=1 Tax=Nitrosomonas nitrosa TaxID=52442 RepID=UPI0023FA1F51